MKIARNAELAKPVAQYTKFFQQLYAEVEWEKMCEKGFNPKQVFILEGATGKGKTRSVYDDHGFGNVYEAVSNKGLWFDGYTGESVVLFDECAIGDIMSVTQFLRLTDGRPLRLPVKGGFVNFNPDIIYFTTNVQWEQWWSDINQEHLAACRRRITEVRVFKESGAVEYR
jgi:hypothetical protein